MSTVLTNGIIIPDNGSRNWGGDLANNWNILDVHIGYMTDVKNRVTTLENSVAENTANIEINTSNISALQTSKQNVIEDLETIRAGASSGATAVQPSELSNYVDLSSNQIISGAKRFTTSPLSANSEFTNGFFIRNNAIARNEVPSQFYHSSFRVYDKNDHIFGEYCVEKSTSGYSLLNMNVRSEKDDGTEISRGLYLTLSNDGSVVSFHPSTNDEFSLGTSSNKWKDVNTTLLNGKTPAYAYNTTSVISNMHVGSVLTGNAKNVAFILPLNIDGSPTIAFDKLVIRGDGNYLFGSTSNSNVTTSYTFTSTVVKGGLIVVLTFSNAETKVPNNSCVATHVVVRLTY